MTEPADAGASAARRGRKPVSHTYKGPSDKNVFPRMTDGNTIPTCHHCHARVPEQECDRAMQSFSLGILSYRSVRDYCKGAESEIPLLIFYCTFLERVSYALH